MQTGGFAPKALRCLKYAMSFTSNSGASGNAITTFAGNGCFDPQITATGHQPYYWDTYTSVYNYYAVLSSRI